MLFDILTQAFLSSSNSSGAIHVSVPLPLCVVTASRLFNLVDIPKSARTALTSDDELFCTKRMFPGLISLWTASKYTYP